MDCDPILEEENEWPCEIRLFSTHLRTDSTTSPTSHLGAGYELSCAARPFRSSSEKLTRLLQGRTTPEVISRARTLPLLPSSCLSSGPNWQKENLLGVYPALRRPAVRRQVEEVFHSRARCPVRSRRSGCSFEARNGSGGCQRPAVGSGAGRCDNSWDLCQTVGDLPQDQWWPLPTFSVDVPARLAKGFSKARFSSCVCDLVGLD